MDSKTGIVALGISASAVSKEVYFITYPCHWSRPVFALKSIAAAQRRVDRGFT